MGARSKRSYEQTGGLAAGLRFCAKNFLLPSHKRPTLADPNRLGSGCAGQAPPCDRSAATVANLDVGSPLVHLGAPPCRSTDVRDRHGNAVADPAIRTSGRDASSASSKTGRRLSHPCASTTPAGAIPQRPFRRWSRSLGTLPPGGFEDPIAVIQSPFCTSQLQTSVHQGRAIKAFRPRLTERWERAESRPCM